jgi:RNA polymerase primary sigma factor
MGIKSALNNSRNSEETILESYLQEISSAKPLSNEEEARLAELIHAGDSNAKDKLVKANLKFVVSIARQYANESVSILDLINEGNIALIQAAEKFDPSYGKRFSNYSVWHLRKAMEAFIPKQNLKNDRANTEEMASQITSADYDAINLSDNNELAAYINLLPAREQNVLKDYYGISTEQMTMVEIGMKYKMTRERVRQIRNTALRHLHQLKKRNTIK